MNSPGDPQIKSTSVTVSRATASTSSIPIRRSKKVRPTMAPSIPVMSCNTDRSSRFCTQPEEISGILIALPTALVSPKGRFLFAVDYGVVSEVDVGPCTLIG